MTDLSQPNRREGLIAASGPDLRLNEYREQAKAWLADHHHTMLDEPCVPCQMATNILFLVAGVEQRDLEIVRTARAVLARVPREIAPLPKGGRYV